MLPVPQREVALLLGESRQAVLPLLWLRRAWHRHRLSDAVREDGFRRRRRRSRAACRPRTAARGRRHPRPGQRRFARPDGSKAARFFEQNLADNTACARLRGGPRHRRDDHRGFRAGLTHPMPGTRCSTASAPRRTSGAACSRWVSSSSATLAAANGAPASTIASVTG